MSIRSRSGFSLIELMVVLVVLGILMMIAVPVYNNQIQKSNAAADNAKAQIIQNSIQKAVAKGKLSLPLTDSASVAAQINQELDPIPSCTVAGNKFVVNVNTGKVTAKSTVDSSTEFELIP